MPRKIILPLVLGLFLTGGSAVWGQQSAQHQHQHQQHQNASSQNQSKPTSFLRNLFGIGDPATEQKPQSQQQSGGGQNQHAHNHDAHNHDAHNHGPAGGGNNSHTQQTHQQQQQMLQQQQMQQRQVQPPPPQQTTNMLRNQNNDIAANPGAIGGSRVPSREMTFSPGYNDSPRMATVSPTESEAATLRQLNELRNRIRVETADALASADRRKGGSIIPRSGIFDTLESERLASSASVGLSKTNKPIVNIDMDDEEYEEEPDEPVVKHNTARDSGTSKLALPKDAPSSKRAVVEAVPPQKGNKRPVVITPPAAPETADAEDEEENEESGSKFVSTGEDWEDEEEAEDAPPISTPRKIAVNPAEKEKGEETPAASLPVKSNAVPNFALLDVEKSGPQKTLVGQEYPYQFTMINRGGAAAEQVVLSVEIPVWAEIQSFDPKVGSTSVEPKDDETNLVHWSIDRLEPGESQKLVIHLIPRQRKLLTMSCDHKFKQPVSQMVVDVLEPKLEMSLEGPFEMLWGTKDEIRLKVQNTGNGDAEEIYLTLFASENEMGESVIEPLGTLEAGQEKILTIEALANKKQQEKLEVFVQASSPYGLQAEARRTVKILRPKLTTLVEAPEMQFVGNQNEYQIAVQNTGTATAQNVEIKAMIPSGAKYVAHQGKAQVLPPLQNQVVWTVDSIPVGEEFVCSLICEMKRDGVCQVDVSATEKTGLNSIAIAATHVEAIADLVLKLENPQGPVEVGKIKDHTITVTNRGSKPAEDVEVIVAFANGVIPVGVEGGKAMIDEISDEIGGQVFFDKIPVINPKQSVVLKVKAKSESIGMKKVRVEMICPGIDVHSVQEDSTRYGSMKGQAPVLKGTGAEDKPKVASNQSNVVVPRRNASVPEAPKSKPVLTPPKVESNVPVLEPLESFDDNIFEDF